MGVLFVLYDWSEAIDWRAEEAFCVQSLQYFGRSCERFVYSREGARERIRKKADPLAASDTRLCGFGVYDFAGGEIDLGTPHAKAATYLEMHGQKMFLLFVDDTDLGLNDPRLHSFIAGVASAKAGGYGFALEARRNDLVEVIALGVGVVDSRPEVTQHPDETTAWIGARRDAAECDRPNILRNVYGLNILPASLLSRSFSDDATIADWIKADPVRGQLEQITARNSLWSLPPENINNVRVVLRDRGMLPSRSWFDRRYPLGWDSLRYPWVRVELLAYLAELIDPAKTTKWLDRDPHGPVIGIEQTFHFFFDDHKFDAGDEGHSLFDEGEVAAIAAVKDALEAIHVTNRNGDDRHFLEHSKWPLVINAAATAHALMSTRGLVDE